MKFDKLIDYRVLIISALMLSSLEARSEVLMPLPSVPDYTRGGGFGVALGIGAEYETSYDGSDEYELEFSPVGAVQWRSGPQMLYWEDTDIGWRIRLGSFLFQAGGHYEFGREAGDSEKGRLDGLNERDGAVTGFVEGRWTPDGNWSNWLGGRIFGGDIGYLAVLAAGRRFGSYAELYTYTTFATEDFNERDFGISDAEIERIGVDPALVRGLSRFTAEGGYRSVGMTFIYRQMVTAHVEIGAELGFEYYADSLRESPLSRQNFEPELGISASYVF